MSVTHTNMKANTYLSFLYTFQNYNTYRNTPIPEVMFHHNVWSGLYVRLGKLLIVNTQEDR